MKRSELKKIVKECLIEIVGESFINEAVKNGINSFLVENGTKSFSAKSDVTEDNIIRDFAANKESEKINENKIRESLDVLGIQDPVMKEIMMDTAKTTMLEHVASDGIRPGVKPGAGIDISSMPGADKWKDIAF